VSNLIQKLHAYLTENNPDLLQQLEKENKLREYLYEKVNSVDVSEGEEACMEQLTEDLRPSKFHYISSILEEEFATEYYLLLERQELTSELINMVYFCEPLLEEHDFKNNEEDRFLRYAVTGAIKEYLEGE
jgi:hypothetical protein